MGTILIYPPSPQGGFESISNSLSPPIYIRVAASTKYNGGFRGKRHQEDFHADSIKHRDNYKPIEFRLQDLQI